LLGWEMASANVFHRLDDGRRPACHAHVEPRSRLGDRIAARAVDGAVAGVDFHLVFVTPNGLVLEPDRRAHGAIGMERIVRPIAAWIGEIEPPRIGHRAHLEAALAAERASEPLDRAPVAGAAMGHEDAELLAVRTGRDAALVFRRVDDVADVPIEAVGADAKQIFAFVEVDLGLGKDGVRDRDHLALLEPLRRLPKPGLAAHIEHSFLPSLLIERITRSPARSRRTDRTRDMRSRVCRRIPKRALLRRTAFPRTDSADENDNRWADRSGLAHRPAAPCARVCAPDRGRPTSRPGCRDAALPCRAWRPAQSRRPCRDTSPRPGRSHARPRANRAR